jgi:5-formyltetrahydrofolate cyclo-ligase
MGISEEKADLRTRYRRERSERYLEHSFEHLADIAEIAKATTIASYFSYAAEPDTRALNLELINQGKILLLPRIAGKNLEWVRWDGDESQISKAKKIAEPKGPAVTELGNVELIVVPALRIDRSGYRLGQGGGYYDRTLPKFSAFSIGLIHPDEISSEDLPREQWDIPLHAAATPDVVIRFTR